MVWAWGSFFCGVVDGRGWGLVLAFFTCTCVGGGQRESVGFRDGGGLLAGFQIGWIVLDRIQGV